ncbi:MAG: hypothetical protein N2C14_06970 [Planctomycetales bacterium]
MIRRIVCWCVGLELAMLGLGQLPLSLASEIALGDAFGVGGQPISEELIVEVVEIIEEVEIVEVDPVEDPFAAPMNLEVVPLAIGCKAAREIKALVVGKPLQGRRVSAKAALISKHGCRVPSRPIHIVSGELKKKSLAVKSPPVKSPHGILDAPKLGNSPQQNEAAAD